MDTDLEAQRDFLLRSLDDLEAERAEGNIDDATYERLHGDYTARAATVLRALDGEPVDLAPGAPPVSAARRTIVVGSLIAFAIAAAVTLAVTIGPRLPGQTVTGGAPSDEYTAHIARARDLLGTDRVKALEEYGAAQRLRPEEPEPPTYIGWILGLASDQVTDTSTRADLLSRSLNEFAHARKLDPKYADAYVFEGLVRDRFANDPAAAVPLLERYLVLAPDGPQAEMVRTALTAARTRAEAPTTTTTR
jgi:hypothetical protein